MTRSTLRRRGLLAGIGSVFLGGVAATRAVAGGNAVPSFFVRSIEPENPTIDLGETFDVSGRIVNLGTEGTRTVEYRIDGRTLRSEDVTLDAAEERTVTFEGIDTESLGAGSFTHSVYSDRTGKQGTLVVQHVGVFEVSDLRPRLGGAEPGGTFEVTATINNTGGASGSQAVRLLLDGEEVASEIVGLAPGESQEVSFTVTVPEQEGEYTHALETDDDRASGAVSVAATSGDEGGAGISMGPGILLALGGGGALTVYGAYTYLNRRRDDGTATGTDREHEDVPAASSVSTGAKGSTVLAAAIDDNLETCDRALSEAESAIDRGAYDEARAACERARTAATDAREATERYDPDRLGEVESRLERVYSLEATIQRDATDG